MLKLYSNIKKYRKMFNMNQQALAEAVGYTSKSMIAQIENGKVDLSASMISKFAEVFHVSELELMGLDDKPVTDEEHLQKALSLFDTFESLSPELQTEFLSYLEYLRSRS